MNMGITSCDARNVTLSMVVMSIPLRQMNAIILLMMKECSKTPGPNNLQKVTVGYLWLRVKIELLLGVFYHLFT